MTLAVDDGADDTVRLFVTEPDKDALTLDETL